MTKIYITEAKLTEDKLDSDKPEEWLQIGFYTDLKYLGITCKTGGFQNHIGQIELVRYRIYDPTSMPEVKDYLDLLNKDCPIDLGSYTVLDQEGLHRLASFDSCFNIN